MEPFGAYRVENSSWLRGLERINAVHPHHRPEFFRQFTRFLFIFHDSTFECIAAAFEVSVVEAPLQSLLDQIDRLRR